MALCLIAICAGGSNAKADLSTGHGTAILLTGTVDCAWAKSHLAQEGLEPHVEPQTGECLGGFSAETMVDSQLSLLPFWTPTLEYKFDLFYWVLKVRNVRSHRTTWYLKSVTIGSRAVALAVRSAGLCPSSYCQSGKLDLNLPVDIEGRSAEVRVLGPRGETWVGARMGAAERKDFATLVVYDEPMLVIHGSFGSKIMIDAMSEGFSYSRSFSESLGDALLPSVGPLAKEFFGRGRFVPLMWNYIPDLRFGFRSFEYIK